MATLDYEPNKPPDREPLPVKFIVAYLVVCSPCVASLILPSHAPHGGKVLLILGGAGIAAALFIVLRRPREIIAWIALLIYGGLFVLLTAVELLRRLEAI